MLTIYKIPEVNVGALNARLEKMNRKAKKLGLPPVTTAIVKVESIERNSYFDGEKHVRCEPYFVAMYHLEVTGDRVQLPGGWMFVGTLEHVEAGNILRTVPGETVPESFRTVAAKCDHCKLARRRKDTYLVRDAEGAIKQVGHNCVADYLGHATPEALALMAEIVREFSEAGNGDGEYFGVREKPVLFPGSFLALCIEVIKQIGFVSSAIAKADPSRIATSREALIHYFPTPDLKRSRHHIRASAESIKKAETILAWAKTDALSTTNDYGWNLKLALGGESCELRNAGLLASAPSAYDRYMGKLVERATKTPSKHFGTVGARGVFRLTVVGKNHFESDFGGTTLYRMTDVDGNAATWWTGTGNLEIGASYYLKGTIKEHADYKGTAQTVLSRCEPLTPGEAHKPVKQSKPRIKKVS